MYQYRSDALTILLFSFLKSGLSNLNNFQWSNQLPLVPHVKKGICYFMFIFPVTSMLLILLLENVHGFSGTAFQISFQYRSTDYNSRFQ